MAYDWQILPLSGHRWPTGSFWLYNLHFTTVGPTVAFQPILIHVCRICYQWANGGPLVFFVQDGCEQ